MLRFCASISTVILLSACTGGSSNGGNTDSGSSTPIAGTSMTTLERNLGITAGKEKRIRAATTFDNTRSGTVRVDTNPARISASVGGFTTPVGLERSVNVVMNGQVSRSNAPGHVFYVPRTGSDVHVGMVHLSTDDGAFAGIFGNETGSGAIGARAAAGGKATYVGQAEYSQDVGIQTAGYRGDITANADFDTGGLDYKTRSMELYSNTGGAKSMRIEGSGTFSGNGEIRGNYTTIPSSGTGASGTTSGAFYGPTGQNIGLVFKGDQAAGAAILDESN